MRPTNESLKRFVGVFALLLLLQACGSGSGRDSGQQATGITVTPDTTVVPGSGGQPLGGLGEPVQAPAGRVSITLSASSYARGDVISGVIANGLDRTLYTMDSKSDCSIAILERQQDGAWTPILGCAVRRPPVTVAIGPSRGRTIAFDPSSSNFAAVLGRAGVPLVAGTYRLRFTYGFSRDQGQEPLAAQSSPFQITD